MLKEFQRVTMSLKFGDFYKSNVKFEYGKSDINVWDADKKSNFIYSLAKGYYVEPFYLHSMKTNDKEGYYKIIDGNKRIATVISFMKNEFALSEDLKDVTFEVYKSVKPKVMETVSYKIAGKKYCELQEEMRDNIRVYFIDIRIFESNVPDEIIEECFSLMGK